MSSAGTLPGCGAVDWRRWGFETAACAIGGVVPAATALAGHLVDDINAEIAQRPAWDARAWEAQAVQLATRYGAQVVTCAAGHLLHELQGDRIAALTGQAPRRCHSGVRLEHRRYLLYLFERRVQGRMHDAARSLESGGGVR